MARRGFRRSSGRPLRPMDWGAAQFPACGLAGQQILPCTSVAAYLIPPSTIRGSFTDPTLMASLIHPYVYAVNTSGSSGMAAFHLMFGLIDWDDVNDVVPIDYPTPYDNGNLDWIGVGMISGTAIGGPAIWNAQSTSERGDGMVQWRSRRRLGNDKGILYAAYLFTDFPTSNFTFYTGVYGRFLFKE